MGEGKGEGVGVEARAMLTRSASSTAKRWAAAAAASSAATGSEVSVQLCVIRAASERVAAAERAVPGGCVREVRVSEV